jgi:HlyD family type I secretion membrane fusion protein
MIDNKDSKAGEIKKDSKKYILVGLFIVVFGFGAFLIWASTAPLAQGVVAMGRVTLYEKRHTVQNLYGGVIKEINIREGSEVKKGDVLLKLNEAASKAKLLSVKSEYYSRIALEARLLAENRGLKVVDYPQELINVSDEPDVAEMISTQNDLFKKRRESIENEKRILQNQKDGTIDYIKQMEELVQSRNKQIALLEEEIESVKEIAAEGYYPKSKMRDLQQTLQSTIATKERTKRSLSEIDLRVVQLEGEFLRDVEMQLADVQKTISTVKQQFSAEEVTYESMTITAPNDGVVIGLTSHNVGGVISPGQKIFDIVPLESDLIVEVNIMPQDIDSVELGLKAEVRFHALDAKTTPTMFGVLDRVSPDVFFDQSTGMSYYLGQVKIPEEELEKIGGMHRLQAGMPADIVIQTGERTMLEYLINPFLNRFALSFKEK